MVSRSIVAIGLDAADHALIEKWSADGHLPNLARLRRRGSYGTLRHIEFYSDETPWTNFLTGCTPQRTGFWSPFRFSPETYEHKFGPYDFSEFRPFYALNEQRSICVTSTGTASARLSRRAKSSGKSRLIFGLPNWAQIHDPPHSVRSQPYRLSPYRRSQDRSI